MEEQQNLYGYTGIADYFSKYKAENILKMMICGHTSLFCTKKWILDSRTTSIGSIPRIEDGSNFELLHFASSAVKIFIMLRWLKEYILPY